MKKCSRCKSIYPATTEFFYKRGRLNQLRSECKECYLKCKKIYYKKNKHAANLHSYEYYRTVKGRLRRTFASMKHRCENPEYAQFKYYGGRGIKCLFKSSEEFVNYVINELKIDPRGLQVDRKNNNGHYEPGNVQFVTAKENALNRRLVTWQSHQK